MWSCAFQYSSQVSWACHLLVEPSHIRSLMRVEGPNGKFPVQLLHFLLGRKERVGGLWFGAEGTKAPLDQSINVIHVVGSRPAPSSPLTVVALTPVRIDGSEGLRATRRSHVTADK